MRKLALEILSMEPGQRLGTVAHYAEKLDLGRGTIQAALNYLEEQGAVVLDRRGHAGTLIASIDYGKLWLNGTDRPLTGVMPLPYSKRYEGLATGLYQLFREAGLPFSLAYMRGSCSRVASLKEQQYDFALVSKLAAEKYTPEVNIAVEFGPESYVSGHRVLFASADERAIRDGMRVGIDNSSIDQVELTRAECAGRAVELVEMPYNQVIRGLMTRQIDAAVWNVDEVIERGYPIHYRSPTREETVRLDEKGTIAAIVVRSSAKGVANLLKSVIDVNRVLAIQRMVLEDRILPSY